MSTETTERLRDRFRGALIGVLVGDALGMPVEGMPADAIRRAHGELREMLDARLGRGTYTDDGQMMIGLAEGLLDAPGRVDLDRIAARFAENFDPRRGYGGNTQHLLGKVQRGTPWREAVERHRLPGGSFANGAAMRVAPVALAFHDDEAAVADAAEQQAELTGHSHPLGRFGARAIAVAVHRAIRHGAAGEAFDAAGLIETLLPAAPEEFADPLRWIAAHGEGASPPEAIEKLGVSGRAVESVPAALWAFVSRADDAEEAIVRAVHLGGDTDTVGAMAGAIAGGYHGLAGLAGVAGLPARWVEALEDGPKGQTHVIELADRFATMHG